jgi:small redox-active disulfide protein 2
MAENDVRTITVDGTIVGMVGLEAIFAELREAGNAPSVQLGSALVELAGQRNYIPPSAASCYAKALLMEYRRFLGEEIPEEYSMLTIKILGPGCPRCESLAENVRSALAELGLAADVEHVREPGRIGEYGVLGTPALVVNGKVKASGKVLSKEQILILLSGQKSRD